MFTKMGYRFQDPLKGVCPGDVVPLSALFFSVSFFFFLASSAVIVSPITGSAMREKPSVSDQHL